MALQPDFESLDLPTQIKLVKAEWQSEVPRLLIFDNCDGTADVNAQSLLAEWRPISGGCRVLVTTRRGDWEMPDIRTLPLEVLTPAESLALLRDLWGVDDPMLPEIAEMLGHLPLALHLAGSFLGRYWQVVTPANYLAQLQDESLLHPSLQGRGATQSPTGHELHVAQTFSLSYQRLDANDTVDSLALQLLARTAYFAPGEPIPEWLLLASLVGNEDQPIDDLDKIDGLNRLITLGLITTEAEVVLIHRLLARYVQQAGPDKTAQLAVEGALIAEMRRHRDEANFFRPEPLFPVLPHLQVAADVAEARADEDGAKLCGYLGYFMNQMGDYKGARPYYERYLAIKEKVLGPGHPDTALGLNNLGGLLNSLGDFEGARPYLERALAIREQELGPDHPQTAISLNNLGLLLQDLGDYKGARPYLERVVVIFEKTLGAEHLMTARSLNNLGGLLDNLGDFEGARPYLERALAIREQELGPDHPQTAISLNNLGTLLDNLGDDKGARAYYERALTIWEEVLGPDHPDTVTARENLETLGK